MYCFLVDPGVPLPSQVLKNRIYKLIFMDWFYNFDFDRDSLLKFAVIKREMIDRGLFEPEEVVMYEYNTDFDVSNLEV